MAVLNHFNVVDVSSLVTPARDEREFWRDIEATRRLFDIPLADAFIIRRCYVQAHHDHDGLPDDQHTRSGVRQRYLSLLVNCHAAGYLSEMPAAP